MVNFLNINVPRGKKLFVIGDVHEHSEQFCKAIEYFESDSNLIFVSVGDILEKGFGCSKYITDKIKNIIDSDNGYLVKGNHEIKVFNRLKKHNQNIEPHISWLNNQPKSLSFSFYNGTRVTVVHGGVRPCHSYQDLQSSIEVCFCRLLDKKDKIIKMKKKIIDGKKMSIPAKPNGIVWHEKYDGRFGYIISGHNSQKDGIPKFYNYSCNIDTACYHTGILTGIVYDERGRNKLLEFKGKSRFPDLDQMYIDMANGLV